MTQFNGCHIKGIAAAVPQNIVNNRNHHGLSQEEIEKTIQLTGVESYRRAKPEICASDLCYHAAVQLFNTLDVDPQSVDVIIFVSQTPDYRLPSTACTLQDRLGCRINSIAFDINLGCSGFIVGVFNACSFICGANMQRVLLLCGDTQTKLAYEEDKTLNFLMGDAGTAILIEKNQNTDPIYASLFTDGSRFQKLIIPAGGYRTPSSELTREIKKETDGQMRSLEHIHMSGMDIFNFSVTDVVQSIRSFMNEHNVTPLNTQFLLLHQANKFMTDKIARKLGFHLEQALYSMQYYGNTSCASIPLTIAYHANKFQNTARPCLLSGFGVGLSWGVLKITFKDLVCSSIVEV